MSESNALIRPKKKLKQCSIRDYLVENCEQNINNYCKTIGSENNTSVSYRSDPESMASTSGSRTNDSNNELGNEWQISVNQNMTDLVNDPKESENMIGSECCELNDIPETPELVMSDDESDNEVESLSQLNRIPHCSPPLPRLSPDSSHNVLYRLPFVDNTIPKPFPDVYEDSWDSRHVKMPNSLYNQINAIKMVEGLRVSTKVAKWDLIEENLLSDIKCSEQLEEAIKAYNPFMQKYNFDVLNLFFNQICEPEERNQFFSEMLPKLIELTLDLPSIITQSVLLLKQKVNKTLFLSQKQIACLLANAFFCTFPKRSQFNQEFQNFPIINFFGLFTNDCDEYPKTKIEKLRCIINYFRRVLKQMPKGVVSFERRYLTIEETPDWNSSNKSLRKLKVLKDGLIEREGYGLLQVDFANKYIGGGVIGWGCVQEEIRFAICPELIISRLFTEKLLDTEVVIIKGCEQFNSYSGYANTFSWDGDFIDSTPHDSWGRRCTEISVIDALYFTFAKRHTQYETKLILRELNKAFCGFIDRQTYNPLNKSGIASGNWGCGAFNGDPKLKALIQLMAASQADRDLVLFTFNDSELKVKLEKVYQFIINTDFKVKHLYKSLKLYQNINNQSKRTIDLFDFICNSRDIIFKDN